MKQKQQRRIDANGVVIALTGSWEPSRSKPGLVLGYRIPFVGKEVSQVASLCLSHCLKDLQGWCGVQALPGAARIGSNVLCYH